jgi:hypothetical protein
VDLYSGDLIWQTPFGNEWVRYLHPLVVGQNIYIDGNGNDYMHIFNAANGKMAQFLWITYATDWTPAYADGKVYSRNFEWFAENDPVTGQVTWFLTVDIMTNVATAPVIGGRTAYIAGISSLSAINLDTHSLSWKAVGSFYATMPAVAGNSVYALNGSRLDVRDAATGSLLKSYTAPDTLLNAPVVTSTAVFVSTASNTYELDRNTLNVVWSAPEGGELTVADGYLFIARTDGYVSAYRAQEP